MDLLYQWDYLETYVLYTYTALSDQLISELQSRDRLLAHKDFLLEKIQNLTK